MDLKIRSTTTTTRIYYTAHAIIRSPQVSIRISLPRPPSRAREKERTSCGFGFDCNNPAKSDVQNECYMYRVNVYAATDAACTYLAISCGDDNRNRTDAAAQHQRQKCGSIRIKTLKITTIKLSANTQRPGWASDYSINQHFVFLLIWMF